MDNLTKISIAILQNSNTIKLEEKLNSNCGMAKALNLTTNEKSKQ